LVFTKKFIPPSSSSLPRPTLPERAMGKRPAREREREGDAGGERDRPNLPATVRMADRKREREIERQRAMGNFGEREPPVAGRLSLLSSSLPSLSPSPAFSLQLPALSRLVQNVLLTHIFFFFFFF